MRSIHSAAPSDGRFRRHFLHLVHDHRAAFSLRSTLPSSTPQVLLEVTHLRTRAPSPPLPPSPPNDHICFRPSSVPRCARGRGRAGHCSLRNVNAGAAAAMNGEGRGRMNERGMGGRDGRNVLRREAECIRAKMRDQTFSVDGVCFTLKTRSRR